MNTHLNVDVLGAYSAGKLADGACREIEVHLRDCDSCGDALDRLSVHAGLLDRLRHMGDLPGPASDTPLPWIARLKQAGPVALPEEDEVLRRGRLGQYDIVAKRGAGGMGAVYCARHAMMQREVAVKVLPPALARNRAAHERFLREVQLLAQLDHPHIVRAYDAGVEDGIAYLVMELVPGSDCQEHVKRHGPFGPEKVAAYLMQAAAGLQHAHERRFVHRDIKPSNLLLNPEGTHLKISDLGLARAEQAALGAITVTELTAEGMVMGTPDFLAPEQWQDARSADIRADLYSLGCTAYYLLTGQPPYPGGTYQDKMARHCRGEPTPLSQCCPDVPPRLRKVVVKLMEPRPELRFQTPAELIAALDQAAAPPVARAGRPPRHRPAPGRRRMWVALALGMAALALSAAALAVVVVAAISFFGGPAPDRAGDEGQPTAGALDQRPAPAPPPPAVEPGPIAPPPPTIAAGAPQLVKTFRGHTGEVTSVAFAPDGTSFASASFDQSVRLWRSDEDEPIAKLPHKDRVEGLAYAPDSKTLATCTDKEGAVRLWDVATRKETLLGTQGGPWGNLRGLAFRADGQVIASGSSAIVSQESVKLWNVAEKKALSSLGPAGDRGYAGVYALAFCPGSKLLAVANHVAPNPCGVRIWDTETREELDFLAGPSIALAFSPDGRKLATAEDRDVTLWSFNAKKKTAVKDQALQAAPGAGAPKFACATEFAPDNRTLAVAYNDGSVILWNTQTAKQLAAFAAHALPRSSIIYYQECSVAFAQDGRHLLTGSFDHTVKLWKLPTDPAAAK